MKRCAAAAVCFFITACPAYAKTMYVNSDNGVRLRKNSSSEAEIIKVVRFGEEVEVISETEKEDRIWAKIVYQGQEGYAVAEFLSESSPLENLEYLGNWMITAYAETGNCCANGSYPSVGYTVACNSLPFGTKIYIAGVGVRTVEDRGPSSLGNSWLDLYLGETSACISWGVQYLDVYLVKE